MENLAAGRLEGFTLIELLVVVLIIGILAAVALPQYQVAVEKSRITQSIVRLNALKTAANSYYLANGAWPTDVTLLDIDITKDAKAVGQTDISAEAHKGVFYADGSRCAVTPSGVACYSTNTYLSQIYGSSKKFCNGVTAIGDRVCKSMGGVPRDRPCGNVNNPCYELP